MPTGYTTKLYNEPQSFKNFIMRCARAFGALVNLRGEPLDTPIPDQFQPSTYHLKALEKAEAELEQLQHVDPEAEWERETAAITERNESNLLAAKERRDRYMEMIAQVEAWEPPTPEHKELKTFMFSQIQESIKSDCSAYIHPTAPDPETWLRDKTRELERSIEYHKIEYQKELDRTANRNLWLKQLRESINV